MKAEWEAINRGGNIHVSDTTERMMVEGGWLVRNGLITPSTEQVALTFVPDAEHRWTIDETPNTK